MLTLTKNNEGPIVVNDRVIPYDAYETQCAIEDFLKLQWANPDKSAFVTRWKYENEENFLRGLARVRKGMEAGLAFNIGILQLQVVRGDGDVIDLGLVSTAVVTDVGCQKIVAAMNTSDAATAVAFKFHGIGTGVTAESSTDTALGTELTTEYNPNSTRATGTQTTGGTTKVYRTVATNTIDSGTPAITEHGVLSQAATGGGSLLDRSVFAAINLIGANGDGIQSTYDFTTVSGS